MKAMQLRSPRPVEHNPLELVDLPIPEPTVGEVVIQVEVCGICRTDLHVVEGDLPPVTPHIISGHEVVGHVVKNGAASVRFEIGARVGAAWLYASCEVCTYCLRGDENLCERPQFTGYHKNGGFAEYCAVLRQIHARTATSCCGLLTKYPLSHIRNCFHLRRQTRRSAS